MNESHELVHEHVPEQDAIRKHGGHELVHELDHVIAFHERFGRLPRSGPVFGKRNRDGRLRGFFS